MTPREKAMLDHDIEKEPESSAPSEWCMALHGNHDEHQCHKKPGHVTDPGIKNAYHECYCGVWW